MAYSYVVYTGDGTTTDYTVPFPYLDITHVAVTVDGVATTPAWISAATVRVSPAPANGVEVRITRNSNRVARLGDYQDAQVLTEADMDADARQLFYVAQEAFDAVDSAPTGGDMRRSMNLSDVYDLNAARQNIGAVAKAGDTMTGPLSLPGAPSAPNHAVTKAYVDAVAGSNSGADVDSFNSRTGNVTLLSSDVTGALGYTPVNKAGDTMAGPLILQADPSAPLGAATKQYVDANIGGGTTGEYIFTYPASPSLAAMRLTKTITANTNNVAGAANLIVTRTGGQPLVNWLQTYYVRTANGVANGDIGMRSLLSHISGPAIGLSGVGVGPRTNPGSTWQTYGVQANVIERVADQGIKRDRSGSITAAMLVAPSSGVDVGDGPIVSYNTSFGIIFTSATPASSTQRMWTPLFFERDCTVPTGVQALHRGGSSTALAPAVAMEVRDYFVNGIDMRNATFTDPLGPTAIYLAQGHAITLGPSGQRMYVDPSGNLTFFDNVAGTRTLNDLGGGVGTNILPLNNTWTGKNLFRGTMAEATIDGDPVDYTVKVTRKPPAGGTPGVVQSALLVNTVTDPGTSNFEWNILSRLENFATGGENVGVYSGVIKRSTGHTWGAVFDAQDHSGGASGNLYGIEVDLVSDGLSGGRLSHGIGIFYGAATNLLGAGATTKQTNGLLIQPFVDGRNQLGSGVKVDGYCDTVFNALADGLSAFRASGAYAAAVIDISTVTSSPLSIAFAPGSRMHFQSGMGNGSNRTYWPGGFVPNYVGAVEVVVDGTKMYIPLALNHP